MPIRLYARLAILLGATLLAGIDLACDRGVEPADLGTSAAEDAATTDANETWLDAAALPDSSGAGDASPALEDAQVDPTDAEVAADLRSHDAGSSPNSEDASAYPLEDASTDAGGLDADLELDAEPPDVGDLPDAALSDTGVSSLCGNGVLDGVEACDDGNVISSDGCASDCRREIPYNCVGEPSVCVQGPALGTLRPGDNTSTTGGALQPGEVYFYRLDLSEDVILTGTLTRPTSAMSGDLDLDLLVPAVPPTWNVVFSSATFGNEAFTTPVISAGTYVVMVSAWAQGVEVTGHTLSISAHAPSGCGNGLLDSGEDCDDGNTNDGDGCSSTCELELGTAWTCNPSYYGGNDGCDCGCGLIDPDCDDATAASCLFCSNTGSCNSEICPGTLVPVNNAVCR